MGFAMPGSIGAKYAYPDRKILSISGDAGFAMNVQELETAVRLKLNIVAMVWVDGEYGLIKWKQQDGFDGKHSDLAFGNPNFAKLAEAYGMWGKEISSADQLVPALVAAFTIHRTAFIALQLDYDQKR